MRWPCPITVKLTGENANKLDLDGFRIKLSQNSHRTDYVDRNKKMRGQEKNEGEQKKKKKKKKKKKPTDERTYMLSEEEMDR